MKTNELLPFMVLSDALAFPIAKEMIKKWTKSMKSSITLRDYYSIIQNCETQSTPSFKTLVDVLTTKLTETSSLEDDKTNEAIKEYTERGLDANDVVEIGGG